MPLSVVVEGVLAQDTTFFASTGRALYGWVLERMRTVDPGATAHLHDDGGLKPLTVSPLQGPLTSAGRGRVHAVRGAVLWMRVTALEPETEALLTAALAGAAGSTLDAAGVRLTQLRVLTSASEHRWAGSVSSQELFDTALGAAPRETLSLRFLSPTTFRTPQGNLPFPLPSLVFRTLTEKWNQFTPIDLGRFLEPLETGVRVQSYECRTQRLHLGQHGEIGFVGTVSLDLRGLGDPLLAQITACLGAYAFFSGVGAKTTMGFGQACAEVPLSQAVPAAGKGVGA